MGSTVFSETVIDKIHCRKCNTTTALPKEAKVIYSRCECGRKIRAVTNCTEPLFEFNCKCGYPIAVEYNKSKNIYEGVK